jgi:hypothetical protein
MAVPGDPPDGAPDGAGGADDEYRSLVFDEDFVRAARLQEYSAQERLGEHTRAVRSRSAWSSGAGRPVARGGPGGSRRHGLLIVLLITCAFAAAVYMGLRHPYVPAPSPYTEPMTATVVPLRPQGPVPGGRPAELYASGPAAEYRIGAAGITLPAVRRTAHFSDGQVLTALSTAKDYLVQSSLDPEVLAGEAVRPVRSLLDAEQTAQFDESLNSPAPDGRHAATGWLVRFDPAAAVLADSRVRVSGTMTVAEAGPDSLEVATDHTFAYALRPAPGSTAAEGRAEASLFTVRRELRLRFDREDLDLHRAELLSAHVGAGPLDCAADPSSAFRPLLAGERAGRTGPAATDPYRVGHPPAGAGLCGVLAVSAQPSPAPRPDP